MNTDQLLDEIDALVDAQLEGGEPETGFDFDDPDHPRCPHCDRDWHGLAITERLDGMRWRGAVDADYRYSEDESPVFCPGSMFIGPRAPLSYELPRCPHRCSRPWHQESNDICPGSMHLGPRRPRKGEIPPTPEQIASAWAQVTVSIRELADNLKEAFAGFAKATEAFGIKSEPESRLDDQGRPRLPRPSSTPPMWANDVTRSRRRR
jgi:hypothetical protein